MKDIFLVFVGGGIGASLRYGINRACILALALNFPWATLIVNALGSFLFGLFVLKFKASSDFSLFFAVGVLGGFTTFSSFSNESMQLFLNDKMGLFVFNIGLNIFLSLGLFYLGYRLSGLWT